ncbi:conserved hypothetical protein [Ricinus communis]|uniref:FBD domain-containing protein n=1 Tax=Ricinus communis TaxID=3988 RepID=B9S7V6_RICCO|nr:conserved hypothetical protein [Ricinus communis]
MLHLLVLPISDLLDLSRNYGTISQANSNSISKRKLVFSAPNLETLVLEGDTDFDCHLRSLTSSLQKVSIYSQTNPAHFLSKNYQVSSSTTIRCYNQILQSVCHAKMLLLNSAFVKLPLLEVLPRTSIQSVHSLYLHVTPDLKLHDVNRIAFLLILFPNLKSLTLKSYFESAAPSANLLNSSMEGSSTAIEFLLSNCPKVYLVEIDLDREHNVLVLVKYLLMHAKELNKMKIYYSPEEHRLPSKIIRSIEAFRKASSTAAVYILPRVVPLAAKHSRGAIATGLVWDL